MGSDKALLDRGGETQLSYLARVIGECVDKLFVSTRRDQKNDEERGRFPQIVDQYDDMGPVAGILSALEAHPEVHWLVVACDLPNVDATTIQCLLSHKDVAKPFTAFVSSYDGLPEPLCALYRSGSGKIVREFVDQNLICPRKILIRSDTELLEQPKASALDNVNTPDDLQKTGLRATS